MERYLSEGQGQQQVKEGRTQTDQAEYLLPRFKIDDINDIDAEKSQLVCPMTSALPASAQAGGLFGEWHIVRDGWRREWRN